MELPLCHVGFVFLANSHTDTNGMVECPVIMERNNMDEMKELVSGLKKPEPIKDSGERTQFDTGAVRDMHTGKGRFDLLPMCVLLRLAKHYENGALKYKERNWEQGIPAHSFVDSALRHIVKYMDGQTDEDHLIAAIWNLCGLAWTEEKRPEMMDIPSREGFVYIENNYMEKFV